MAGQNRLPHDAAYRRLFNSPRLVRELLQGFGSSRWNNRQHWEPIAIPPSAWVSQNLQRRTGDLAWRVRTSACSPRRASLLPQNDIYVLLEFQSQPDRWMAVRSASYAALFLESLIRDRQAHTGTIPAVLPIVLYTGERPWRMPTALEAGYTAAAQALRPHVLALEHWLIDIGRLESTHLKAEETACSVFFQLERARDIDTVNQLLEQLDRMLPEPENTDLRAALVAWLIQVFLPLRGFKMKDDQGSLAAAQSLSEVRIMLAQRMARFLSEKEQQWRAEGRQEGRQKGRQEGSAQILRRLLQQRFGPDLPAWVHHELGQASEANLAIWADRVLKAESLPAVFGRA